MRSGSESPIRNARKLLWIILKICPMTALRWHIRCDADGNTALIPGTREDSMVYLHEFTTFIINVMPEDERERAGDYIGHILALVFVPDAHFDVDGKRYTPDDLVEYLLSDPDMLAKVLAYFIKYVETYNLSEDEIRSLAELLIIKRIIAVMKRSS